MPACITVSIRDGLFPNERQIRFKAFGQEHRAYIDAHDSGLDEEAGLVYVRVMSGHTDHSAIELPPCVSLEGRRINVPNHLLCMTK